MNAPYMYVLDKRGYEYEQRGDSPAENLYERFKHLFSSKNEKVPKGIKGLDGVYSMKRLSEKL